MKFHECTKALEEGKKIKLTNWENAYWYRNQEGCLINHFEGGEECPTCDLFPKDMLWVGAGDWEIVDEVIEIPEADFANYAPETVPIDCETESIKDGFCFSEALYRLKQGQKVARAGWNGKGMFLFLADNIEFHTDADMSCVRHLEGELTLPAIVLKTADDQFCVGWLASQTDLLADDWQIV